MRAIDKIIIHCSDSKWGCAEEIDSWHVDRGFDCIGYHFVILNGYLHNSRVFNPTFDGGLETGRDINTVGAHCKGHNDTSIGIVLIGVDVFTPKQMHTLQVLVDTLAIFYGKLPVFGHYEFNSHKTCPNMDMDVVRKSFYGSVPRKPRSNRIGRRIRSNLEV